MKTINDISPKIQKMIQDGKRLNKDDMGYQIGRVDVYNPYALYWDKFKRIELVDKFNRIFGTSIK